MKLVASIFLAFMCVVSTPAYADIDPALMAKKSENFISSLGTDAISSLTKTEKDAVARRKEFKRILGKKFDMNALARFAMGRYWTIATPKEKKKYTALFKDMVIDVYSNRFADYSGQEFEVIGSKPAGRKDFIVNSLIKGSGHPIKVDWRLRKGKVIDVLVQGVSMAVTQRSEFSSVIQRGGGQVASLITHLEK